MIELIQLANLATEAKESGKTPEPQPPRTKESIPWTSPLQTRGPPESPCGARQIGGLGSRPSPLSSTYLPFRVGKIFQGSGCSSLGGSGVGAGGTQGTYKADASVPAWHQGAHVGGAAEASHHGHIELLQDLGQWLVCAQLAPAHGHTLHTFAHALVLGRQPGHLHIGVEGGHPVELQRRVGGTEQSWGRGCDSGAGFPCRGSTMILGCLRAGCPPSACLPSSLTFPICKAGGTTMAEATSLDTSFFFFFFYIYLFG